MDLLVNVYGGESEDETVVTAPDSPTAAEVAPRLDLQVCAAPQVNTSGLVVRDSGVVASGEARHLLSLGQRQVMYNLPFEDLHAPLVGPAHPYTKDGLALGLKNHYVGHVEDAHMHPVHFEEQYNAFHTSGRGHAPGGQGVLVSTHMARVAAAEASSLDSKAWTREQSPAERKAEREAKRARVAQEAAAFDPHTPFTLGERQPWANKALEVSELTEEQKEYMAQAAAAKEEAAGKDVETRGPTSFFHGKEDKDYQGSSWLAAPKGKRSQSADCFLPRKWIHTWSGHTKGVNAIRFFPGTGHLLLSAGLDGKVKIWDVYKDQKCMRSYLGHSKGVRDICFSNDGRQFLSTGYDRNIRLWDTETGAVVRTFNTNKVYYCVKFHPSDDKQNVVMAGCQDKKVYQFDTQTGDVVTEYNYHLGAVNTVTFIDEGRQFVSTSDDKTIRVWELGIPVQVKYIADPSMHSMPSVALHPNKTYVAMQSLDNQIVSYMCARDRFKHMKNKNFKGHNTAGYACQVNFSPDGKYVMSGDSTGSCYFWEWSHAGKIQRTIKAHDGVCIGCEWNPLESSKVATCGWDGTIKYWD